MYVPLANLTCVNGLSSGGKIVAEGTPEQIAKVKKSYTGQFLAEMLARRPIKRPQAAE